MRQTKEKIFFQINNLIWCASNKVVMVLSTEYYKIQYLIKCGMNRFFPAETDILRNFDGGATEIDSEVKCTPSNSLLIATVWRAALAKFN